MDWISVMHYCMVLLTDCIRRLYKVRPEHRGASYIWVTMSWWHDDCRLYDVSTGYPYDSEYCSRSLCCLPVCLNGLTSLYVADNYRFVFDVCPRRRFRSLDCVTCDVNVYGWSLGTWTKRPSGWLYCIFTKCATESSLKMVKNGKWLPIL